MTRKRAKKAAAATANTEDEDEKSAQREYEYVARGAKRARKPKKIRAVHDPDVQGGGAKQGGKKRKAATSAFENEITNVRRNNVKKMRHSANARQNELKRSKKKGKGKGK